MSQLRFGVVSESVPSGRAWLDNARPPDRGNGHRFAADPDHFSAAAFGQQLAPFSALAAAAAVTTRMHVGTLMLSNDFRHPALVAHEAATAHHLSGGRFELGIGAGWYRPEFDAAGIAFDRAGERIDRLEESLAIVKSLLIGTPVHHAGAACHIDGLNLDVLPAGRIGPETVWQMPTVYIGSVDQIRADLAGRRERFGLCYLVTSERDTETVAQIIAGL